MNREYTGKICPYCKTPLLKGDTVVLCSICDMPHHLSCWQDNQGCTTFGCTGSIKEIIGSDTTTAPDASLSTVPKASAELSAKSTAEPPQKEIETLFESEDMIFMADVPLVLENAVLVMDRRKDKLFARCTFRSISDKSIKAVMIEISCQDPWGDVLGETIAFQYLDLRTKRESIFGQTNPIELADKNTRKISVAVKKVLFADNSVATSSGVLGTMPPPVLLSQYLKNSDLAAEYARETTPKAQFVPEYCEQFWRCTCGALNTAEEACHNCGCTNELLDSAMNPEVLHTNMVNYIEQKIVEEEKAQAEQAERIRLAKKQVKLEQEKKEQEIRLAEQKKRRKKAITIISISLAAVLLLACGVIFFAIPYYNYQVACEVLNNGEYDTAYQVFIDLDGFMDSEEMAYEALYQKGEAALENKQYDAAGEIFEGLGDYKDSKEMVLETLYRKGEAALENEQYDAAIEIFKGLDDYEDSAVRVLEAKFQLAEQYQAAKQYNTAYELFVELGDYKDSQDKVLALIVLWEAEILNSTSIYEANTFAKTVELSENQYDLFYSTILLYISAHEDASYWDIVSSQKVLTMLKMLPRSYEDNNTLLKLFNLLRNSEYDDFFSENEALMRQCWSLPFVQDLAKQDVHIGSFLEGYWTGSGYYFDFYEDGSTQHNLPRVSAPYGANCYIIKDMIYYWVDGGYNWLDDFRYNLPKTKVYRFEIVDYDIIKVYCYANNRTYTLYRN